MWVPPDARNTPWGTPAFKDITSVRPHRAMDAALASEPTVMPRVAGAAMRPGSGVG